MCGKRWKLSDRSMKVIYSSLQGINQGCSERMANRMFSNQGTLSVHPCSSNLQRIWTSGKCSNKSNELINLVATYLTSSPMSWLLIAPYRLLYSQHISASASVEGLATLNAFFFFEEILHLAWLLTWFVSQNVVFLQMLSTFHLRHVPC